MRAGQRSYIPGAGHIVITSVEEVRLDDLTEADAIADGFSSLEELKRELAEIYPANAAQGRRLFRVMFELVRKAPGTSGETTCPAENRAHESPDSPGS